MVNDGEVGTSLSRQVRLVRVRYGQMRNGRARSRTIEYGRVRSREVAYGRVRYAAGMVP